MPEVAERFAAIPCEIPISLQPLQVFPHRRQTCRLRPRAAGRRCDSCVRWLAETSHATSPEDLYIHRAQRVRIKPHSCNSASFESNNATTLLRETANVYMQANRTETAVKLQQRREEIGRVCSSLWCTMFYARKGRIQPQRISSGSKSLIATHTAVHHKRNIFNECKAKRGVFWRTCFNICSSNLPICAEMNTDEFSLKQNKIRIIASDSMHNVVSII